jgi:hypothetical protein
MVTRRTKASQRASRQMQVEHQRTPAANMAARGRGLITEALVNIVNRRVPHDLRRRTFADLIAEALVRKALEGDVGAAKEIADRIEGSVPLLPVEQDRGPAKVTIISHIPRPDRKATVGPTSTTAP